MDLHERILADLHEAMRAGDQRRKLAIRAVRAAITNAEVDRGRSLTDEEVLGLIAKEVKQRRDSIAQFRKGQREDLVSAEQAEIEALESFLPHQLSSDEIRAAAQGVIAELGAEGPRDLASVMRQLMPSMRGRADGGEVSRIVRDLLKKRERPVGPAGSQ